MFTLNMQEEFVMFRTILIMVASTFCASCTTAKLPSSSTVRSTPASTESYRLGVGDKVRVLVFKEAGLTGEFSVSDDGNLSLPLIGDVAAKDKTVSEVRRTVQLRLADGFLVNPDVSMEVLTFRPFYILGEVNQPGQYPFSIDLTVLGAIARAEGFTYRADKKRVFVKSAGSPDEVEVVVTASTPIRPGDTVRVVERYF